jgi:hypothetical protein
MKGTTAKPLLSLVFAAGQRPDLAALVALGVAAGRDGFVVDALGTDTAALEGAELLVQGLTFDCFGLAPGAAMASPDHGTLLGLRRFPAGEALSLQPGPHIAAGAALLPVTQALLGLGAVLARLPGVLAVCWHPAQAWLKPDYFQTIASDWIKGGAFPALGLATLHPMPDGGFRSQGLAFFTGQELRLEARLNLSPERMAQLAIRLIDQLVIDGRIAEPRAIALAGMPPVLAVPVDRGQTLVIRPQLADRDQ